MRNILLALAMLFCATTPSLAQQTASNQQSANAPMDAVALANAAHDAIEALDLPRFLSLFTDDAVIWHNYDRVEHPVRTYLPNLFARIKARGGVHRYMDRRYVAVPGGAILQHTSTYSVGAKGQPATESAVMQHIYVRDGHISRIEEYFDRSQSGTK